MPPPPSKVLARENQPTKPQMALPESVKVYKPGEEILVKKVTCYNDFVAILQFRIESSVLVSGDAGFKNEGMVVGYGPGLAAANGRVPSQLKLGDVVVFYGNPTTSLEPKSGVYCGQKIIIVPERSIICGMKPMPFKVVTESEVEGE